MRSGSRKKAQIKNLVKTGVNNTNVNFANSPLMRAATWTSGSAHSWRSLMEFALPSLPANANVYDAKITLFATTQGSFDPYGNAHSLYSSSNASVLQRITESWSEDSVPWANRPTVSTTDQISIAQSADNIVGDWHEDVLNRNGAIKTFIADGSQLQLEEL